jgi:hypothetical protein
MRTNGLCFDASPRYTFFGYRSPTPLKPAVSVGMVFLVTYLGWLLFQISQSAQEVHSINQKVQMVQSSLDQAQKSKRVSESTSTKGVQGGMQMTGAITPAARTALNGVIQHLNVPWHDIFEQLEASIPPDVALLSIEPDGQRGQIRLQAEAQSLDSLLRYASTLQQNGIFGRLSYSKHETNDQDPNRPARLSFELGLSPPKRLANSSTLDTQGAMQ